MNLSPGHNGYLHLILGPMFAEKSTTLLRNSRRLKLRKKKCLLVKYQGDNRYTDQNYIATHDQIFSSEEAISCEKLSELTEDLEEFDVICIDEIQFFADKLQFCQKWRSKGKIVMASGLFADFRRIPFPEIPELIAISDKTEFLKSICEDCSRDLATTSYRLSEESDQVVIGGSDKYLPLCQGCYERRSGGETRWIRWRLSWR